MPAHNKRFGEIGV